MDDTVDRLAVGTVQSSPPTPLGRAKEQAPDPRCPAQGGETGERTPEKPTAEVTPPPPPPGMPGLWMEQGAELTFSRAQPCGQGPACWPSDGEAGSTARLFHVPTMPVRCRVETAASEPSLCRVSWGGRSTGHGQGFRHCSFSLRVLGRQSTVQAELPLKLTGGAFLPSASQVRGHITWPPSSRGPHVSVLQGHLGNGAHPSPRRLALRSLP